MTEQYFSRRPRAGHDVREFTAILRGRPLTFRTDSSVFAKRGVDPGTERLVEALEIGPGQSLLDLGCGYGPIGLAVAASVEGARVVMTDVNRRAVALARRNAGRNALAVDVREGASYGPVAGLRFDHIASNPPIRAGKDVLRAIVEGAPAHLERGGSLWLVARHRQGAPSLRDSMREAFGDADVVLRRGGYWVLRARLREPPPPGARPGPVAAAAPGGSATR